MPMKKTILMSVFAFVVFFGPGHPAEQKEYLSPDGKYCARVISLPNASYGGESKVTITDRNGRNLRSKSYVSTDGEHGFGVEKAAWTPDSKFFVYSMSSSGGHQPWHFPTEFISIIDRKVRSLDDYTGPIIDSGFVLSAPNTVKTMVRGKERLNKTRLKISLAELMHRAFEKKK